MKRQPTCELLDSDSGTPAEVAGSLRDLQSFNERLGGTATARGLVQEVVQVCGKKDLSMLEVAAGNGFVPAQVAQDLGPLGIRLKTTLLDRAATHLPVNGTSGKIVADALALPFADSSFDLVSSSLFLHHLSPSQVIAFARESLRVSRIAVLVNDLVRHWLHLALAHAGAPLYRSRLTKNDAPASVRQAYTIPEMKKLLHEGGAAAVEARQTFLFRMGVVAWK